MSGKLTLDTDAGGSVTLTVDDTETGDIEYPLDTAGIDSGVGWIRYPDGTQICFVNNENSGVTINAIGSVYNVLLDFSSFPQPFIDIPSVTVSSTNISGVTWASVEERTESSLRVRIVGTSDTDNGAYSFIAIGRWK